MKKLFFNLKNWVIRLLTEIKDDLIGSANRQWYIVVMAVLLFIGIPRSEYWIGVICILVFIVMALWLGFVKFKFVEQSKKQE